MASAGGDIRLVVSRAFGKPRNPKEVTTIVGTGSPLDYRVFNSSANNLLAGIYERLFFVKVDGVMRRPHTPQVGIYQERLGYLADAVSKHVPKSTPIEREAFPLLYQARRRTLYEKAVTSLYESPVQRRDARCTTFTKVEKVNFSTKVPVPRIIQPRNPRYNVEVGVYLKPLEALICKSISRVFNSKTIVKGMNADQVGQLAYKKWTRFRKPVAVSLDATRFDQHVSQEALKWEHSVYIKCFRYQRHRDALSKLLSWQLENEGHVFIEDKRVKYSVKGARMSGDMNTGLGNCLIACCIIKSYCDHFSIPFELLNNGDDCCIIVDDSDLAKLDGISSWFHDLGFTIVIEPPAYELEHIEFCQSCFISLPGGYRMVRKPKPAISKDSISVKPLTTERLFKAWLHAVGEGGLALNSGVPVLQEFYLSYLRSGQHHGNLGSDPTMETGTRMLTQGMVAKVSEVSPESRYSFWLATGILPDMQVWLEAQYRSVTYSYSCNPMASSFELYL